MTRALPGLRTLLQAAVLAALGVPAAFGQGMLSLYPGFPTPSDELFVSVFSAGAVESPCAVWQIGRRSGQDLRLEGTTVSTAQVGACPGPAPILSLGRLAAGRYRLTAWIDGGAGPYAEIRFDVRAIPESPPRWRDVALSTPAPRAGVPFALVFSATENVCNVVDFSAPPVIDGDRIVLDGDLGYCAILPPSGNQITGWRHMLPPLTAGNKTIEIRDLGNTVATFDFHVDEDASRLPAADGRFEARLRWTDRAGVAHDATAVRLTEESGQFWFFDPANPEVTVKLVDGTGLNGRWWVFVSSMTDLGFTLTVGSESLCAGPACEHEHRYTQIAGHNRNFVDTAAFAECTNCGR